MCTCMLCIFFKIFFQIEEVSCQKYELKFTAKTLSIGNEQKCLFTSNKILELVTEVKHT